MSNAVMLVPISMANATIIMRVAALVRKLGGERSYEGVPIYEVASGALWSTVVILGALQAAAAIYP